MFDIASTELLLVVIVAVVVIGPKDLPRALYKVGQVVGKARAMSRHFRSGLDAMMREVEMEEMEKKWSAENRRIMEKYPDAGKTAASAPPALAAPEAAAPAGARANTAEVPVKKKTENSVASGEDGDTQTSLPLGDQSPGGTQA